MGIKKKTKTLVNQLIFIVKNKQQEYVVVKLSDSEEAINSRELVFEEVCIFISLDCAEEYVYALKNNDKVQMEWAVARDYVFRRKSSSTFYNRSPGMEPVYASPYPTPFSNSWEYYTGSSMSDAVVHNSSAVSTADTTMSDTTMSSDTDKDSDDEGFSHAIRKLFW